MFSHYDRPRIAQLCEKAGLYVRALQHYSELIDIKRVFVNTHAIEPQALVEFFGTLSKEWALECMKDLLLVNLRGNLQIIVQVAKEYCEQLGLDACIKIFEQFRSYEGLYFFLGSYLSSSEDPDIHFKYIEAAAKTGQKKEVERVTRESNFYDPEKTKNFLMEAKLPDARPLINVCDLHGFVPDLTHYLYTNNMLRYIEGYVQKVNPVNAPMVVGQLLDDECPEDFIKGLILSVRSLLPVEPLVEQCEKRDRVKFFGDASSKIDKFCHNILRKRSLVDSSSGERSTGLNQGSFSKIGPQSHPSGCVLEIGSQRLEDKAKIGVPNRRIRTSLVEANGTSRTSGPLERDKDILKSTNGSAALGDENDRSFSKVVDGWERLKMKKKRSVIKSDVSASSGLIKSQCDRETKRGLHQKLSVDARPKLNYSHSVRLFNPS